MDSFICVDGACDQYLLCVPIIILLLPKMTNYTGKQEKKDICTSKCTM